VIPDTPEASPPPPLHGESTEEEEEAVMVPVVTGRPVDGGKAVEGVLVVEGLPVGQVQVCIYPGCNELVYPESGELPHVFCSRNHERNFERKLEGLADKEAKQMAAEDKRHGILQRLKGSEYARAGFDLDFTRDTWRVCARPDCGRGVRQPRPGAEDRRFTRYNFCSPACMQWALSRGWEIPYGTSVALADTDYLQTVLEAGREAERLLAVPAPHPLDVPARSPEELQALQDARENIEARMDSPLPLPDVPEAPLIDRLQQQHKSAVLRQRKWMQNQLDARKLAGEAGGAKYNGSRTKCPLCISPFRIGQIMVMCHLDTLPAPVWIHVACANAFMKQEKRPRLVPR